MHRTGKKSRRDRKEGQTETLAEASTMLKEYGGNQSTQQKPELMSLERATIYWVKRCPNQTLY